MEVEKCGRAEDLKKVLETSGEDVSTELLLDRWRKEMLSTGTKPRPSLIYHLARIGMRELHTKLVFYYY